MSPRSRREVWVLAAIGAPLGCEVVAGLGDFVDGETSSGGSGGAAMGGAGGSGAIGGSTGGSGGRAPWLMPYSHRKRLTLDTKITQSDLVDFSTPVVLAQDPALSRFAAPDARDVAFTDSSGALQLSHEIEAYDSATGSIVAWVRLPTIQAGTDTQIYMYFGSDDAVAPDPSEVWPLSLYRGVWHLSQDPVAPPPQIADSTAHQSDGVVTGAVLATDGRVGPAIDFVATADLITIADDDHLDFDTVDFTVSCWVRAETVLTDGDRPAQKIGGAPSRGWLMSLGSGVWVAEVRDGVTPLYVDFGLQSQFVGEWVQLALVVDGETGFVVGYANGEVTDSTPIGGFNASMLPNNEPLYFSPGGANFVQDLDEVRLYGVARGQDWIRLDFHAMSSPSFVSVDPLEDAPTGP